MKKAKYIIRRTGRRCTRYPVVLDDGSTKTLEPVGSHVWELTPGEVARIRRLKDTRVIAIKPEPVRPKKKAKPKKAVAPRKAAKKAAAKK